MTFPPSLSEKDWPLQRKCDFASEYYSLLYAALIIVTYTEYGLEAVSAMRYNTLRLHQRGHFLDGLRRLGIDPDGEPPAVVAAKYHYFSNALGGLDMEYVEESPKKAWVRYNPPLAPMDTGWLAMPPKVGRILFEGWHAFNGDLLGCPRLGFVVTRGFSDDEPYAEGYFQEYDHDLEPSETLQFSAVETAPEFDPRRAPKLDPGEWPPDRQSKAKRNFRRRYVQDTTHALLGLLGVPRTGHLVRRAFKGIAIQYGKRFMGELGIRDRDASGLAAFIGQLGDIVDEPFEIDSPTPGRYVLRRSRRRLFEKEEVPAEIHRAMFAFTEVQARMMSPRIRVKLGALQDEGSPYDEVVVEDINERLS